MNTYPNVVTPAQAPVAHALASAFAHHWSILSPEEVIGKTTTEISDLACEREEPGIGCVNDAPVFEEGDIEHTTTSGRLFWRVALDGSVTIRVYRPAQADDERAEDGGLRVVNIYLPSNSEDSVLYYCYTEEHAFLPRHLAAARQAVQALLNLNPHAQQVLDWLGSHEQAAERNAAHELNDQLKAVRTADQRQVAQAIEHMARRVNSGLFTEGKAGAVAHIRSELLRLTTELAALT